MTSQMLSGTVRSGGAADALPIANVHVTLYEAGENESTVLGIANTDAEGNFTINASAASTDSILYVTAHGNVWMMLAAVIGPELGGPVVINELTTVAAGFSMAQFIRSSLIRGNAFALRIAAMMCDNLVLPSTGEPSEVMLQSPNADETNSLRSIRTLGNLLAGCVREHPGALEQLRKLAKSSDGTPPADLFQAVVNICLNPANNVGELYNQAHATRVYLPPLESQPAAWTLVVKVNRTAPPSSTAPDNQKMFGGPANIAFDRNGYAWITNNVFQGTPNSGDFNVVLRPDGKPADGLNGAPKSPLTGGGTLGGGFGVALGDDDHVWMGNFGWGTDEHYPKDGSLSLFTPAGDPRSPPEGYVGGTYRPQGFAVDGDNNLWIASFGNNRVVVWPNCQPENAVWYPRLEEEPMGVGPFGVAIGPGGNVWVTNSGGLGGPTNQPSSLSRYQLVNGRVERVSDTPLGSVLKGCAVDGQGNVWVASGGDNTVYMLDADGNKRGEYRDRGGITGPWNVAVDGNDDIWVANFSLMDPEDDYTDASVTKLAGVDSPSGKRVGEAISPDAGYTLPNAGSPVILPNGDPLYKHGECYSPLMRMTSVVIDAAGNLWAVNNWKPRFATSFPEHGGNPGGDGICIFVGIAKPLVVPAEA